MGVNVVYAPVLDVATEPDQPGPRDPLVRRRPGRGRAARGGVGPRPADGRCGRRGSSTSRGSARRPSTRTTASRPSAGRASGLDAVELVPFRAGIEAGARLVMSAHVAVPALDRWLDASGDARHGPS